MGAWKCDIYSNDIAQDFLINLQKISKEEEWWHLFLKKAKENKLYEYEEAKYVLADLELDLIGKISNEKEIVRLIGAELDNLNDYGEDAKERGEEMLKFLKKIENKKEPVVENIYEWFNEKRKNDIL